MAGAAKAFSMELRLKLEKKLAGGLECMGLSVSLEQQAKLIDYIALICKWNQVHNLTAIRDPLEMVTLHALDSLSILPYVDGSRLLDVGAGAGLPSIPLSICRPYMQIVAVDAVQKKVSFMRQAKIELGLDNFTPIHARVERLIAADKEVGGEFDIVTSRAFSEMAMFIGLSKHLLLNGGRWLAMKGVIPDQEMGGVVEVSQIKRLEVAGLNAERHLIIINNKLLENKNEDTGNY